MKREDTTVLATAIQPISADVLKEKYLKPGEATELDLMRRVAKALAMPEREDERALWEERFLSNLRAGAIGAGRIMSAAGTNLQATLINCFVQPVGDCIQGVDDDGLPGIYEALREAAETMRRGGGVGYDFSRIRPRGALVKATASIASGPCSYIDVFDHSCATVESAGSRRGAQMGVLRIDHPDVVEFITAKRKPGRWNNFNVSVAVSDAFIAALDAGAEWDLVHRARPGDLLIAQGAHERPDGMWVYRSVPAAELWNIVMRSAYDFAEPGILFIDNIRRDNNLRGCEEIDACNPCGEEPLPAYGCCDLGPVILTRFVSNPFGIGGEPEFNFDAFAKAVALQVRALDNVLEITHWPLDQQRAEAMAKRRIGVGFTGLGNTLAMLRLRYDGPEGRELARRIAERMRDAAYSASVELAREKGAFPALNIEQYLEEGTFASRLSEPLQQAIRTHGIRNSHLLAIAPTGTVSLAFADNASNGIEPAFSWSYRRKKREAGGSTTEYSVEDHAWRLYRSLGGDVTQLPEYFVSALQMSVSDHLAMMEAVQPYVDTAISKTVNIPEDYPYEDFKHLYHEAWQSGLKGMATYRPNQILGSVLETSVVAPAPAAPAAAPEVDLMRCVNELSAAIDVDAERERLAVQPVDPMRSVIAKRPKGVLPGMVEKVEYWTQQGRQALYLVVSFIPLPDGRERAVEFFMPVGQSGESQEWITASMRLLSLAARGGFLDRALSDMRKVAWDRGPVRLGTYQKADGTSVPMWHDSEVAAIAFAIQNLIAQRNGALAPASAGVEASAGASVATSRPNEAATGVEGGPPLTLAGSKCPECGAHAMIRKDGCDYCTQCGHVGSCG